MTEYLYTGGGGGNSSGGGGGGVGSWTTTVTSSSATNVGYYVMPTVYTSGGISYQPSPAPAPAKEPSPLEWLDAEVEKTCALARA